MIDIACKKDSITGPSPRILKLAEESRERASHFPDDAGRFNDNTYNAFQKFADLPKRERQARTRAEGLELQPVHLFPDENLVGMIYHLAWNSEAPDVFGYSDQARKMDDEQNPGNRELVDIKAFLDDGGWAGHVTWHWDWILEKGINGILAEYREALKNPKDETAKEFYQGVITVWEAVLRWNDKHVAALEKALSSAPVEDKPRLENLINICKNVPANGARNFHEAVQAFWFQYIIIMREDAYGGNGPGRLDYLLWPYLEKDLESGQCTLEEARELIDELFIRLHERILPWDGWVETIVVGGCHPDGKPSITPLTRVVIESIMGLDQTHPSVYVRVPDNAPECFLELTTQYLIKGKNRAQILNDRMILEAMNKYGMPLEDARWYTCGGCMEIVPQGRNSDLLFAAVHNVSKTAELVLTGGECLRTGMKLKHTSLPTLPDYKDFEDLYAAFEKEMHRELNILFKRVDLNGIAMAENRPTYLLSSLTLDCLERGREQQDGGARYPDYGTTPLGIPNAGDALYAVKRAVYDDKFCTAEELLEALKSNFEGYETLRMKLRALPKFGQQNAEADAMANRVLNTVMDVYAGYRNRWGGRVKSIIFTFVWAPEAGCALGATADGQFAGMPIAHGLTPQSNSMTEGITAAIGSHCALSLENVAGAASSMWDIDPQWATPKTINAILKSFLSMGGQIFQGNMTDVDEMIRAKERPEDYGHLIVRVGGFSAKFVTLGSDVQDDIINRYRHKN